MPLVHRSMHADGDKPRVGDDAKALGVRVAPDVNPDIPVDSDGTVQPTTGGMSVAPSIAHLPSHRIPRRLKGKFPKAAGSNNLICWRMGDGPFEAGMIAAGLRLRPDEGNRPRHGVVEPDCRMGLAEYRAALAATREAWTRSEA